MSCGARPGSSRPTSGDELPGARRAVGQRARPRQLVRLARARAGDGLQHHGLDQLRPWRAADDRRLHDVGRLRSRRAVAGRDPDHAALDDARGGADGARRLPAAPRGEPRHAAHHLVRGQLLPADGLPDRDQHAAGRDRAADLGERRGARRLGRDPDREAGHGGRHAAGARRVDALPAAHAARDLDARGGRGLPGCQADGRAGERRRRRRLRDLGLPRRDRGAALLRADRRGRFHDRHRAGRQGLHRGHPGRSRQPDGSRCRRIRARVRRGDLPGDAAGRRARVSRRLRAQPADRDPARQARRPLRSGARPRMKHLARSWVAEAAAGAALPAAVLVLVAGYGWLVADEGLQTKITLFFINVVFVVALQTFSGNSGILSFGQMAFVGVGAYVAAILTIDPALKPTLLTGLPGFLDRAQLSFVEATAAAAAVAALVALVTGLPILRLDGASAVIAILSLLLIADVVFSGWIGVTLGVAVLVVFIARWFRDSKTGLLLRGSREDAFSAASVGVFVRGSRMRAWVLSGALSGAGGALFAFWLGTVSPTNFFLA